MSLQGYFLPLCPSTAVGKANARSVVIANSAIPPEESGNRWSDQVAAWTMLLGGVVDISFLTYPQRKARC
jgi:hypothetical protein